MLSPRIAAVALLSALLAACSVEDDQVLSQVAVTFYPPTDSFPTNVRNQETLTQKRSFSSNGSSPAENITINQRRDGDIPIINDELAAQNATFLVSFYDSTTLDVYSNHQSSGKDLLYSITIFSDITQQHICLPSIHLNNNELVIDLPVKHAETKLEAHEFILACRQVNEGVEEKAE